MKFAPGFGPAPETTLNEKPPPEVADLLLRSGLAPESLRLCTPTDIDFLGNYKDHWLAVTSERLVVISDGHNPGITLDIPLEYATEYRAQTGTGSGILQARVNGTYVDVLRYSNRCATRFEKVARKLDRGVHGESIELNDDDRVDSGRCRKCGLMLEVRGETCPRCISRGAVLWRLAKLMAPYRVAATAMMALLIGGIALDLVSPQLTRYLVDEVLPGAAAHDSAADSAEPLGKLTVVVLILACVQLLRMGVNLVNGRLSSRIGTAITADMRNRLVAHLQKLAISFYDKQQIGSLVGRVAYDTETLHGFVNQFTGGFLLQILMLVGVGVMMFVIDAKLAMYTLIPAPLVIAGTVVFWRYIYPRNYRFWDASSKQAGMLSGLLSGIRVVKAFNQENREITRFAAASSRLRDTRRDVDLASATFNPIMGLVFQFGGWIVWYVGGRDVIEHRLTLGELMAFFGYLWMFYGPLATLPQFTNWLTTSLTQAHRLFELLDSPVQIVEAAEPKRLWPMQGHVRFEGVNFGYTRHTPVLRDLSLDIQPGEMVGVVGHSGSGKTTIVNLLCRFYDVQEGRVCIDGIDVRELHKDDLRTQVGVVLQEPFLFRGSIWENLAYGLPDASPDSVISAAKAANCHDFILRQPHAYDTWVGERGAGLSGGEKQRIGIARVLLTDPRILILDEATSNVDAESEAAIQAALAEVVRGRTTVAIAHRLSTLRNADRIIVVDNGRIIESGTHSELLALGGQYAKVVKMQQGIAADLNVGELAAMARTNNCVLDLNQRGKSNGKANGRLNGNGHAHDDADGNAVNGDGHAAQAIDCAKQERAGEDGDAISRPAHKPRWLDPAAAVVHLGNHDALHVTVVGEAIYGGVFAVRCLPVRYPDHYISLRHTGADGHEHEVGLIRELAEWPASAQRLMRESLAKRYFVHTIFRIHRVELTNNYLDFSVDTDLGPQRFTLRWQSDRAHDYGPRGKMLLDTDENRYLIPDVEALGTRERAMFERYIYW